MSFKDFSSALPAAGKDRPADKAKEASPAVPSDQKPAQATPAPKS